MLASGIGTTDFAVRVQRYSSKAPTRPPIRTAFVTIASRPSAWDGTAADMKVICANTEAEYVSRGAGQANR